jgi:hypothetical protein
MRKQLFSLFFAVAFAFAGETAQKLDGTWNLGLQGDHVVPVALVLKQDGAKVSGTMMLPGNDVVIEGTFENGQLTFTGRMEDHTGQGAAREIKATGKLRDDGTMEGDFAGAGHGTMHWTAEKLKSKK